MQGGNLLPVLAGSTPANWRKSFYYHYYEYPEPHRVQPHYGVVTDRYKLVRFYAMGPDYMELYDLQKDPNEMKSVFGDPAYAKVTADLQKELARLRQELKVPEVEPPTVFGNPPSDETKTKKKAAKAGNTL